MSGEGRSPLSSFGSPLAPNRMRKREQESILSIDLTVGAVAKETITGNVIIVAGNVIRVGSLERGCSIMDTCISIENEQTVSLDVNSEDVAVIVQDSGAVTVVQSLGIPKIELRGVGDLNDLYMQSTLCGGVVVTGKVDSEGMFVGVIRTKGFQGQLDLETDGATWNGSICIRSPESYAAPFQIDVEEENGIVSKMILSGKYCTRLLPYSNLGLHDPAVSVSFLPQDDSKFCIISQGGRVRLFDLGNLNACFADFQINDLHGASCVSMCFGTHSSVFDEISRASALCLFRRHAMFVLVENGTVIAVLGVSPSTNEAAALLATLESTKDPHLKWAKEMKNTIGSQQIKICEQNAPRAATSFIVIPQVNSPVFSMAVCFANGLVHTFVNTKPLEPCVAPVVTVFSSTLNKPHVDHRDSPLKGIGAKIRNTKQHLIARPETGHELIIHVHNTRKLHPPPVLVGRTLVKECASGCKIIANSVYPNICHFIGEDSVFTLYVPWIMDPVKGEVDKLGTVAGRKLFQLSNKARFDLGSCTVISQPGLGQFMFCCEDSDSESFKFEFVDLSSELALLQQQNTTVTPRVEAEDEWSSTADDADDMIKLFSEQLTRLTYVPKPFRMIKPLDPATPPAMSLALCTWLHDMSDSLLYGKSEKAPGLMQNIRQGFEFLEKKKEEQTQNFEIQIQALQYLNADLKSIFNTSVESDDMLERLDKLQSLANSGLEDAEKFCRSAVQRPFTAEEKMWIDNGLVGMEARALSLQERISTKLKATVGAENRAANPGMLPQQFKELGSHIQELQSRTHDLLNRIQNTEAPVSIASITSRLDSIRSRLGVMMSTGLSNNSMVSLFTDETTAESINRFVHSDMVERVLISKSILLRDYQRRVSTLHLDYLVTKFYF